MIVVTAPTSNIGLQVLENILDNGEPVRVIARDASVSVRASARALRSFRVRTEAAPS